MRTRAAPIGRVWTKVLRRVGEASLITTEGIAVHLRPLAPNQLWPTPKQMGYAAVVMAGMEKRGYVRRAHPWTPGKLWAVGNEGRRVLEELAKPRARRYRSSVVRRTKAKHRRDALAAQGLCINGARHGRATRGCRCESCATQHGRSA